MELQATAFGKTSGTVSSSYHTAFTDVWNPYRTSVIDGNIQGRGVSFITTDSALGSQLISDGIITMSLACTSNVAEQVLIYPLYLQ